MLSIHYETINFVHFHVVSIASFGGYRFLVRLSIYFYLLSIIRIVGTYPGVALVLTRTLTFESLSKRKKYNLLVKQVARGPGC